MSAIKKIWLDDFTEAEEDFQDGKINEEQFRARLESLGLPSWKIEDAIKELNG